MNEREISKLIKKHLSEITLQYNFKHHRRFLIFKTKEPIHSGILFEGSGYSKGGFICTWYIQPLFVPLQYFTYSVGRRFSGWYEINSLNEEEIFSKIQKEIQSIAFPLLRRLSNIESLIRYIIENNLVNQNRNNETLAYCGAWLGNTQLAAKYLAPIVNLEWKGEYEWKGKIHTMPPSEGFIKMKKDATALLNSLSNYDATRKLLESNIRYTLSHLKLPKGLWPEYEK